MLVILRTSVRTARFSMLVGVFLAASGCTSLFQANSKKDSGGSENPPRVTKKHSAVAPTFQHGFGQTVDAFGLVDQLDVKQLKPGSLTSKEHETLTKAPPPSLIYTGDTLLLSECSAAPSGAKHVSELWTQSYLLDLFAPDLDLFGTALSSLEESDSRGVYRPANPVHPNLVTRLKAGTDPLLWTLNGIRFRFTDRKTLIPDAPLHVDAQIKLNYELDKYRAGADRTIQSASFIHSIAISPSSVDALLLDVLRLSRDQTKVGCDIFKILNKYIANQGLRKNDSPRSSYFFLHTNIFDGLEGINEWRFTEHKMVINDRYAFTKETQEALEQGIQGTLASMWETHAQSTGQAATTPGFVSQSSSNSQRVIMGPYDNPITEKSQYRALRIVPMAFPHFYLKNETTGEVALAEDVDPVMLWFSGTNTDENQNEGSPGAVRLLLNSDGTPYVPVQNFLSTGMTIAPDIPFDPQWQNPAFRHEELFTCAQCHTRQVSNTIDGETGKLKKIAFMNFRHIGYGDGNNRRCDAAMGATRVNFRASLSPFLLDAANGWEINGLAKNPGRAHPPKNDAAFERNNTERDTGSLDNFRCLDIGTNPDILFPQSGGAQ